MADLFCIVDPSLKDLVGHHFEYDLAVARGARDAGYRVVCLSHRDVEETIGGFDELRPTFGHDIWSFARDQPALAGEERTRAANAEFLADLNAGLAGLPLDSRSIVLGHMITRDQLLGWAEFAQALGERRPRLVLLLRYQLDMYKGAAAEQAFRLLERLHARGATITLVSDSARLAEQMQTLTSLDVGVLPIPHTHAGDADPLLRKPSGGPLRVVTLGNARDEKGVLELLAAIRLLEARGQADRFEFVLQANHPDAPSARGLGRLRLDPPDNVTLIEAPLSPDDYAALLRSADIVALPYWRSIYEARTSGVLVEAMATGKPVCCTADTWMSDQLTADQGVLIRDRDPSSIADALQTLLAEFDRYAAAAQAARPGWLSLHNPASFMQAIQAGGLPARPEEGLRVAVLYPWGDAHSRASGASLRVNLFAHFLAERAQVRVIEDADYGDKLIDGIRFENAPLLAAGDASRAGRVLRRVLRALGVRDGEELYPLLHLYPELDAAFQRRIDEVVRWADVVFLEYGFWGTVTARSCRRHGRPFVITAHDVVADQIRSHPVVRWFAGRLERWVMRKADACVSVSAADQAKFARWGVAATLIPQFADVEAARAAPEADRLLLNRACGFADDDDAALFLFVGSRFRPNLVAVEHLKSIAAETRAQHPDLDFRVVVVGSCSPPVREGDLAALGFVDQALLTLLYQQCAAAVIPLTLGTGASLKTVEALAAGAPVLGTDVAFRGVEVVHGVDGLREDDLSRWPDILNRLATNAGLRADLRRGATTLGADLHYGLVCRSYLELVPRLAEQPERPPQTAAKRLRATVALASLAEKHGLSDMARGFVADARAIDRADAAALAADVALRLKTGDTLWARSRCLDLLERGDRWMDALQGLASAAEQDGAIAEAERRLDQAARVLAHATDHPSSEGRVREALWTAFHAGQSRWVRIATRDIVAVGAAAHADYHYMFASLEEERPGGDLELALRHARFAREGGYDPFWSLRLIGVLCSRTGSIPETAANLRAAAEAASNPDQRRLALDAWVSMAWRLREAHRSDDALEAVETLLLTAPELASAQYLRAELLRGRPGRRRDAIDGYLNAEELGFDRCWCEVNAGRLLIADGDLDAGSDRLLASAPLAQETHQRHHCREGLIEAIGLAGGRKTLAEVRAMITSGLTLGPDPRLERFAQLYDMSGLPPEQAGEAALEAVVGARFEAGAVDVALAYATEGEVAYPGNALFAYYRAECLQVLDEDLEQAEAAYGRAFGGKVDPFWVSFNRGQLRRRLGRHKEALDDLRVAVRAASTPEHKRWAEEAFDELSPGSGTMAPVLAEASP